MRLRNKPDASVVVFHRERTFITENTPDKLELFSSASLLTGKTIRGYLDSAGYLCPRRSRVDSGVDAVRLDRRSTPHHYEVVSALTPKIHVTAMERIYGHFGPLLCCMKE